MTPWPDSASVSDVASSTEILEEGGFGKLSGQIICRPRCVKRNITEEETRLTVKRDCYLLPLEERQVNRNHSSLHLQVNDTLQNGSIVHLETKQLFEVGEYEMYQMEGLTRQAARWRGDIFRYRVCSPTNAEQTLVSFDSLQGRLSTCLVSLRLGISYFEVFTVLFQSLLPLTPHVSLLLVEEAEKRTLADSSLSCDRPLLRPASLLLWRQLHKIKNHLHFHRKPDPLLLPGRLLLHQRHGFRSLPHILQLSPHQS